MAVPQITMSWLRSLEKQAERVVRDTQDLIERAEGRYVDSTPEVNRAVRLWHKLKVTRQTMQKYYK